MYIHIYVSLSHTLFLSLSFSARLSLSLSLWDVFEFGACALPIIKVALLVGVKSQFSPDLSSNFLFTPFPRITHK